MRVTLAQDMNGSSLRAVNSSTLPSVLAAPLAGASGGGSTSIDVRSENCTDHAVGLVDPEAKCFPEAGPAASGPRIAWECKYIFTVKNPPRDVRYANKLWIAQNLVRTLAWHGPDGTVERWKIVKNEAWPVNMSNPVTDPHSAYHTFPKYCKNQSDEAAVLDLVTFKHGTEPPRTGIFMFQDSAQQVDAQGNNIGPKGYLVGSTSTNRGPDLLNGDYRTDTNVTIVPGYAASYSESYEIDHCKLVPVYNQVVDSMKRHGVHVSPRSVWDAWRLHLALAALGAIGQYLNPGVHRIGAVSSGGSSSPEGATRADAVHGMMPSMDATLDPAGPRGQDREER